MEFSQQFTVRWADLDLVGHMRHTAYADYAAHVRFAFLSAHGFGQHEMARLGIGPVLFREETTYLREVRGNEIITVDMRLAGVSPDFSRWKIEHRLFRPDHELAARVVVEGSWIDLLARRLATPPEAVVNMLGLLPHIEPLEELRGVGRGEK